MSSSEDNSKDGKVQAAEKDAAHDAAQFLQQHPHERVPEVVPGYRDFSRSQLAMSTCTPESNFQNFPQKLHAILSNPLYNHACSWLPHGRAWAVLHMKDFEHLVLPKFFRHGRYSSFARQVNGWGFRRISKGPDCSAYYHEMFLKGLPHLCRRMRRRSPQKIKPTRKEATMYPTPDFYAISRDYPLAALLAEAATSVSQEVPHSASSQNCSGSLPTAEELGSHQLSAMQGSSLEPGLSALFQQPMNNGRAFGTSSRLPDNWHMNDIGALITGQATHQQHPHPHPHEQHQHQALLHFQPPRDEASMILSLLRPQTSPVSPLGTTVERIISNLRRQGAVAPFLGGFSGTSSNPSRPQDSFASQLGQEPASAFQNNAQVPSSFAWRPFSAASRNMNYSPLLHQSSEGHVSSGLQQMSSSGNAFPFVTANTSDSALLLQLSQQLLIHRDRARGAFVNTLQDTGLRPSIQGLLSQPVAPIAATRHTPSLPLPSYFAQELLRHFGNVTRSGDNMGNSSNDQENQQG